ncbi:unnamed protein product [Moneuplotes crassus]|uniref:Uncharacterized protein n=1 Tax=Euplotes crassus TaxID=5936 RepID=A0AAD1UG17_EUPCR|nr:unnamed protein product [Moneuplotes crassus]
MDCFKVSRKEKKLKYKETSLDFNVKRELDERTGYPSLLTVNFNSPKISNKRGVLKKFERISWPSFGISTFEVCLNSDMIKKDKIFFQKMKKSKFEMIKIIHGVNQYHHMPWKFLLPLITCRTSGLQITAFKVPKRLFQLILSSSPLLTTLEFSCCTIDSSNCKFYVQDCCRLERLSFAMSGRIENSNWIDYPERLDYILLGISECKLKSKLKTMEFGETGRYHSEIRELMDSVGLEGIHVGRNKNGFCV